MTNEQLFEKMALAMFLHSNPAKAVKSALAAAEREGYNLVKIPDYQSYSTDPKDTLDQDNQLRGGWNSCINAMEVIRSDEKTSSTIVVGNNHE